MELNWSVVEVDDTVERGMLLGTSIFLCWRYYLEPPLPETDQGAVWSAMKSLRL